MVECEIPVFPAKDFENLRLCIAGGDKNDEQTCTKEADVLSQNLIRRGQPVIGKGMHRIVHDDGKCVIKIALNPAGGNANVKESTAWGKVKSHPEIRQFFVPVIHSSLFGEVLVAAKADTSKSSWDLAYDVMHSLKKMDLLCDDLNPDNVGFYDGHPVVVDYGYGVRCRIGKGTI